MFIYDLLNVLLTHHQSLLRQCQACRHLFVFTRERFDFFQIDKVAPFHLR